MNHVGLRSGFSSSGQVAALALMFAGTGVGATQIGCDGLDARAVAKFSAFAANCAVPAPAALATSSPAADAGAVAGVDVPAVPALPTSVGISFRSAAPQPRGHAPVASFMPPNDLVGAVAARHRIDPLLLGAIIARESAGRPGAVSAKGARGLMQLMPATARTLGVRDPRDLADPAVNLVAGATYLKQMQARFGNDLALTLAAYNAGPGAVARHRGIPPYAETRAYVANILGRYAAARQGVGR